MWLENLNHMKKISKKTLEEISHGSGIPKGTLNKLFAGQTKDPQLSTIKAVVHSLGFTLDDLNNDASYFSTTKKNNNQSDKHIKLFADKGEQSLINDYRKLDENFKAQARGLIKGFVMAFEIEKKRGNVPVTLTPEQMQKEFTSIIETMDEDYQKVILKYMYELLEEQNQLKSPGE